ncbi:hypothetical protein J3458_001568 [Metarhizium acridum]|uniref:uncharacterized protein n=1 Tax=Metarhizium acridum TaxID=92637 RepID=UPI001C6CB858|nr:hypothetical protein J3458_001568 [Metarhizium acridum]
MPDEHELIRESVRPIYNAFNPQCVFRKRVLAYCTGSSAAAMGHGHHIDISDNTYSQVYSVSISEYVEVPKIESCSGCCRRLDPYLYNHSLRTELDKGAQSWLIAAFTLGTRYKESVHIASLIDGVAFRYRCGARIYRDSSTRLFISLYGDDDDVVKPARPTKALFIARETVETAVTMKKLDDPSDALGGPVRETCHQ